jgi:hypothetical protein
MANVLMVTFVRVRSELASRIAALRAEPEAGYSTEFWVVTGTVVAVALAALGYWAADVLTAVHNIQLTTNTPGS